MFVSEVAKSCIVQFVKIEYRKLYLRPLIEANYTICEFAKKIGIHRITLYKIFSNKMVPSIEILHKIFFGLGYNLQLSILKS